MSENILAEYMQRRFRNLESEQKISLSKPSGLPFITISRQFGCPSRVVADMLQERLNPRSTAKQQWRVINKEIIENAAKELSLKPQKIKYVFDAQQKTVMDDVISSLDKRHYKSDRKIRKTIREVIENLSGQGHVIIIGRGGVAITNDFPGSFHIRLYAPERWRLKKMMDKEENISEAEAYRKMRYIDKKRIDLINHFSGNRFDFNKFDLQINCENFDAEATTNVIIKSMEIRGLV
jgi:cytidylate kinase